MVGKRILAWMLVLLALCSCGNGNYSLNDISRALAKAHSGDTLRIADGTYRDVKLVWKAAATPEKPVVVMAAEPGKVRITGKSSLHICGTGLEVRGLLFEKCYTEKGTIIEFRNGDDLASGCRLTQCVVNDCNPVRRDISYSYVHVYGRGNRVDHCSFTGKLNLGVTLIVMLNYPGCDENYHSIDHNYFGPRPVYGSNGAETIRIGTSQQCMQNSRTQLCDNLFDRCNGEVEVVSVKSSENTIARNVFYECQGVLALRHGDRNIAEGNLFIGHGIRNTGGIRIVGEDQVVRGNTMLGLAGERFFSALALMYGVPNSLPNRYMQVKNTIIEDNVFEACRSIDFSTGKDFERTLPPVGTVWERNRVDEVQTTPEPSYASLAEGRGASWFTPAAESREEVEEIVLKDSLCVLEEGLLITRPTIIRAAEGTSPEVIFAGRKRQNFITICDGGSLTVKGLRFSGRLTPGRSLADAIISTAKDMTTPYTLTVEDCSFADCGESGFNPIRGMKGTFADSIVIRRCNFTALSGDAINFAGETEDKGRYNADDMIIEDCHFERILGIPINIYRGGSDESTAGPYVYIRNCRFDDASNKVRGSVLRLIGPQVLEISGCKFSGSGRGGSTIRLDEAPWEKISLKNNTFTGSGPVRRNL
jgi:poly(beta-D-mannuronate) lyase